MAIRAEEESLPEVRLVNNRGVFRFKAGKSIETAQPFPRAAGVDMCRMDFSFEYRGKGQEVTVEFLVEDADSTQHAVAGTSIQVAATAAWAIYDGYVEGLMPTNARDALNAVLTLREPGGLFTEPLYQIISPNVYYSYPEQAEVKPGSVTVTWS